MKNDQQQIIIHELRRQILLGIAVAAGLFAFTISILLLYNQNQLSKTDPLDNTMLAQLKKQHQQQPQNEKLKTELRTFDLSLRQGYFDRLALQKSGSYLLLGSLAILLLALHLSDNSRRSTPTNKSSSPKTLQRNRTIRSLASFAVAGFALLVLILGNDVAPNTTENGNNLVNSQNNNNPEATQTPTLQIAADYRPENSAWLRNWPCFRGPLQNGTHTVDLADYDTANAGKIIWKTPIKLPGLNSPIVWDNKVFLSGASSHNNQEIYAYEVETGELLWTTRIPPAGGNLRKRQQASGEAGYAAPTMITDGKRVCAIFATGDLACVDINGKLLWSKNIAVPENHYGYASSLAYHDGKVFVQWDNKEEKLLYAFSIANGNEVWKAARDVEMSWSSPVILDAGQGPVLITMAAPGAIAYDPQSGKELWRCNTLMGEVAPAASTNGKLYFITMQYSNLTAVRPGLKGDITKNAVAWQFPDNLPDTSSPLATDEFVIIADSTGAITCVNPQTGEIIWEQLYEEVFYPSPTLIGGHVYQLDTKGLLRIFSPLPKFELTTQMEFKEDGGASPAVIKGKIFIRSRKHLFCLGMEKK